MLIVVVQAAKSSQVKSSCVASNQVLDRWVMLLVGSMVASGGWSSDNNVYLQHRPDKVSTVANLPQQSILLSVQCVTTFRYK